MIASLEGQILKTLYLLTITCWRIIKTDRNKKVKKIMKKIAVVAIGSFIIRVIYQLITKLVSQVLRFIMVIKK